MKVGFSNGYRENYWGRDWFGAKQLGGSEHLLVEVACELARQGHEVSVRLPYETEERVHRGVRWIGQEAAAQEYDTLFCFDDHARRDNGGRTALVVCRSDTPPTTDFDQLIFLSAHHARFLGHAGRPHVGGGVKLSDYAVEHKRLPRRVLCTVSPDRVPTARLIGEACGDFVHTYKPVTGFSTVQVSREKLIRLQQTAQVFIYPYDPARESDFFSMATIEAMAAGTPCVIADGESHVELWGEPAVVVPRPVNLSEWCETVTDIINNPPIWRYLSLLGRELAAQYDWSMVAPKYLRAVA